ncbi:replication initiation protein [Sinorhizobium meliloti]|uniref:replication initiation protein n=1 Tax=Rhizobium meliloti TaxID=382 RepID=UPI00398D1E2C
MRKNDKTVVINYENIIQKSNELSMAKLSHGLTINQVQLLAYAIYSTQQDGKTEFHKADFEKKFELEKYHTARAKEDSSKLSRLQVTTGNLDKDSFSYWNVFLGMEYERGLFKFEWSPKFLPHILNLKEKYITNDLTITSKFKSSFTWTLYDYMKGHYGYWHKEVSKVDLLKLFSVEDVPSYKDSAQFKRGVLDVAIREINQHTELEAWYIDKKKGRTIAGFDLHWSIASKQETAATENQLKEITTIIDAVEADIWNYLDVLDEVDIEKLQLMNTIQKVLKCRVEMTTTLTSTKANEILQRLKGYLRSLQSQLDDARRKKDITSTPSYVPFYNWLEERE